MTNTQPQMFTEAQRAALQAAADRLSQRLGAAVELDIGATEDGHEWAAFSLAEDGRPDAAPLASIQAVRQPGRRFAVLRADGRESQYRGGCALGPALALAERVALNGALAAREESLELRATLPDREAMQRPARTPAQAGAPVAPVSPATARKAGLLFTDAERLGLDGLRREVARYLKRDVVLETCAEDGDEWALLALPDESPEGFEPLVSVQLATRSRGNRPGPRRRVFDLVGPAGRAVPRVTPTDDLAALLPVAHRAAMVAYRALA